MPPEPLLRAADMTRLTRLTSCVAVSVFVSLVTGLLVFFKAKDRDEREGAHKKEEVKMSISVCSEEDSRLVAAIMKAAEERMPIEGIEKTVGVRATINTQRQHERELLAMTDISGDPPESVEAPRVHSASNVVFWVRPVESRLPRIIGVVWYGEDQGEVFTGVVMAGAGPVMVPSNGSIVPGAR
jgi:hypothetical protein